MIKTAARAAIAAILACLTGAVQGQQPSTELPTEVTLATLLQLVVERSPRLAAERLSVDAAEADRITADVYPNPTVSIGRFKPSGGARTIFDASSQQQVTVDLPLLVGDQRGARVEAAERGVLAARKHVGMTEHELATQAAQLFVGLQAAQERVKVLEASLADVQRLAGVVAERLKGGVASRYELTRVEVEAAAVSNKVDDARIERSVRAAGLASLLGVPSWRPVALGALKPAGIGADADTWRRAADEANLQLAAARSDESAAQAGVRRAERERLPVPVFSLGRTWTSEPFGAANYVGLSTEIPILDKRTGPVTRAQVEYRAAQSRREAIERETQTQIRHAVETLVQRRSAYEQFERRIGARQDALRQMAEDYYQLGRGSILELIDAARSRLESALTGLELRAQLVEEEIRILALSGRLGK